MNEFKGSSPPVRPREDKSIPVRNDVCPNFDRAHDRLWVRNDAFRSSLLNAYIMLLGDEFEFVAIMHKYLAMLSDEGLALSLRSWLGQERAHGVQHRRAYAYLDRVGLRYRQYHAIENFIYFRVIFPLLTVKQRVALVAALEHFNTMIGEVFLREPHYFNGLDAELSLLLKWHFAEEIEHRSVVYNVARSIGVGYVTRCLTGIFAFLIYPGTLLITAFWFCLQSFDFLKISTYRSAFKFLFVEEKFLYFCVLYLASYLSPRFHPSNRDSGRLADPVFAGLNAIANGG